MASAFLYEYLRLGSTVRRLGLIRHDGDQSSADGDKAADDYDSPDYEAEKMMKRKREIFDRTAGRRSKQDRKISLIGRGFLKVLGRRTSGRNRKGGGK